MDKTLTLTRIHNAFNRADRDTVAWEYVPGQSLAGIRETLPPEVEFAISLNGVTIPAERLAEVCPRPGDHLLFVPVVAGNDGKMIGRIIGMIVVAIVAWYAAPAIFGYAAGSAGWAAAAVQGATWGTPYLMMAAGAVTIVGGVLVNALLPPPKPGAIAGNTQSQAYSWSPQSVQQQGIGIPRWYGRNKLVGNIIGGYLQSMGSMQYVNALVALGAGPFFAIPASGIKVNDQPYQNFNGVTATTRLGLMNQDAVDNFSDTVVEYPISQKVLGGTTYSPNVDYVIGQYVQFGGASYRCIAPVKGTAPPNAAYWTPDTPDVTYVPLGATFDGLEVEIDFPSGLYALDPKSGAYTAQSVDVKVEIIGPDGTLTLSQESDSVAEVTGKGWSLGYWQDIGSTLLPSGAVYTKAWVEVLAGPGPYGIDDGWGNVIPYYQEGQTDPTVPGSSWHFFGGAATAIPVSGGAVDHSTVVGNSPVVLRKTWRKTGLTHGTWTVRVTRLTPDNSLITVSNDCYLAAVREIITQKFQYPRQALCSLNALATNQLSGSLRFSAVCDCLYVRVWDGTAWSVRYNNNPAWVLFDVLTQPVYSGDPASGFTVVRYDAIDPSRLDLPKFLEWAQWCDTLCPDGNGGQEKRITFNGGFDATTNLWDAAMQICQVGGASLVWNGSMLTLAIDKPADPVQVFTVGNTGQDSFSETFLSMEDRASEITCTFLNQEKDYIQDPLSVVNPNIPTVANKVSLSMVGVTKPSEVWRILSRRLAYNEVLVRTVSIKSDIDAIACTVGDVILLQSDVPQWGFGGRLVSATTTSVQLDQQVTIEAGAAYSVMVRLDDDTMAERSVTNAPGTTDTLTVSSPFPTAPSPYAVYAFGPSGIEAKPFRVTGIQRAGDLSAVLSCIEYNASVYDVDQGQPVLPTANYSGLETLPPVTGLTLNEAVAWNTDGTVADNVLVHFDIPTSGLIKLAEIWINTGTAWSKAGESLDGNFQFGGNPGQTYTVAVLTVNNAGERMSLLAAPLATITLAGQTQVSPPDVSGLQIFGQANNTEFVGRDVKLAWNRVTPLSNDIATGPAGESKTPTWFRYYELKVFSHTGTLLRTEYPTIENYTYDFEKNYSDTSGSPDRTLSFEVRAVANSAMGGAASQNAARITVTNPPPPVPGNITTTSFIGGLMVSFDPLTVPDVAGYLIHASQTTGFTPDSTTLINRGPETSYFQKQAAYGTWYVKVAAFDSFGEDGVVWSGEYVADVASPAQVILQDLTGQITESQLYADLNARINLIDTPGTGLVATAQTHANEIYTLQTTTATQATQISTLNTTVGNNSSSIATLNTTTATQATQISTLNTTVGNQSSSIATINTSIAGIQAKHAVKIDVNGYVSGYELISDGTTAQFGILADQFFIASPGNTSCFPFIVNNGKVVIDDASIVKLTADKIMSGIMTASQSINVGGLLLTSGSGTNNGSISLGKTSATDTTAGFWQGNVSGTPQFALGNSSQYLQWDGINLTVQGNIVMNGGSINWATIGAPSAAQVGARPASWTPSASDVGALPNTYIDGSGVFTGQVYATNINGTTITGKTIQTASSGAHFVVSAIDNYAHFFDTTGAEKITIGVSAVPNYNLAYGLFGTTSDSNIALCAQSSATALLVQGGSIFSGSVAIGYRWGPYPYSEPTLTTCPGGAGEFLVGLSHDANGAPQYPAYLYFNSGTAWVKIA